MSQWEKTLQHILYGNQDNNIKFNDAINLLHCLGFTHRIKGDHHIFSKTGIIEIINIQPKSNMAKAYQIKQIRNLIVKYGLSGGMNDV